MSRPSSPWPVAAWAMASFTVVALAVSIAGRVLSPALVLDLAALWPILVPVVPALAAAVLRPGSRLAGSAPLIVLTWLLAGLALHLAGWSALPSSAADVTSDAVSHVQAATLTIRVTEGRVTVGAGETLSVAMERIGGRTGAPAVELIGSDPVGVGVTAGTAEGWFRFGGVSVRVPTGPLWGIEVDAPVVELDLGELDVDSLVVDAGAGTLRLGPVDGPAKLLVSGPLGIEIPDTVAATVTGPVRVPSDWTSSGEGSRSPVEGDGWSIEVDPSGGTVTVTSP